MRPLSHPPAAAPGAALYLQLCLPAAPAPPPPRLPPQPLLCPPPLRTFLLSSLLAPLLPSASLAPLLSHALLCCTAASPVSQHAASTARSRCRPAPAAHSPFQSYAAALSPPLPSSPVGASALLHLSFPPPFPFASVFFCHTGKNYFAPCYCQILDP